MVSKVDSQTSTGEFESHWVPYSYGPEPHLSKKLSKLLLLTRSCGNNGICTFAVCICPKVNTITWLEFESAYYNVVVRNINHYATRTPIPNIILQHPTRHQLYGHLPSITKIIQARRTRHAGHCWRNKDELVSDVLLWTPAYGQSKAERPARTYIQQLCDDTGCNPEDLPEAMNDRETWRERVRDIRAGRTTWWWWHEKSDQAQVDRTMKKCSKYIIPKWMTVFSFYITLSCLPLSLLYTLHTFSMTLCSRLLSEENKPFITCP